MLEKVRAAIGGAVDGVLSDMAAATRAIGLLIICAQPHC